MLHRRSSTDRPDDYHAGKWNGLGGKCEADESPLEAAVRELAEESGLELPEAVFRPIGVILFPNFKAHKNEDWWVSVFVVQVSPSEEERVCQMSLSGLEGELHWIDEADLLKLNLWKGDRYFIPWILEQRPFMATIWYEGQDVKRHWIRELMANGS